MFLYVNALITFNSRQALISGMGKVTLKFKPTNKVMIKTKFISEATIQKAIQAIKSVGNWFLVAITALSAFFLGYYYPKIKQTIVGEQRSLVAPRTSAQITVSVTDRGELMIMDRGTGKFEIYEESVGLNVFKSYGSKITQNSGK